MYSGVSSRTAASPTRPGSCVPFVDTDSVYSGKFSCTKDVPFEISSVPLFPSIRSVSLFIDTPLISPSSKNPTYLYPGICIIPDFNCVLSFTSFDIL